MTAKITFFIYTHTFLLLSRKLLCIFDAVSLQSLRLVVKEAICSQGRNKVHDKIAYRPMAWVYNLRCILQHIVDGFDDVSLAQHHPVIERYQLVFHVHTQSSHQLYAILKEKVKQLLRYVTFVCEQLAIQPLSKNLEYFRVFVADICACKFKGYNLSSVIACKMELEAMAPLLSSSKFPAFSALKCLQNSSIIQNNSVTL